MKSQIVTCQSPECKKEFREYYCRLQDNRGLYCSKQCRQKWSYKLSLERYIERWLKGEEDGGGQYAYNQPNKMIRDYLLKTYPACQECNWSKINIYSGRLALQIDHIDGNRFNNKVENLRVLCPNCHALTPTWGPLNVKRWSNGR